MIGVAGRWEAAKAADDDIGLLTLWRHRERAIKNPPVAGFDRVGWC